MSDMIKGSMEFARDVQLKFEFYFTGLIFTLLAASIQTAAFTHYPLQNAFELAGWAALLVSGVAGLSRLEWMPTNHEMHGRLSAANEEMRALQAAVAAGRRFVNEKMEEVNVSVYVPKQQASLDAVTLHDKKLLRRALLKHETRKWAFLVGLCFVIASRAYEPILTIACSLRG